jgi:hypothetical protein
MGKGRLKDLLTFSLGAAPCRVEEALARHGRPEIFNTDQGSQFTRVLLLLPVPISGRRLREQFDCLADGPTGQRN